MKAIGNVFRWIFRLALLALVLSVIVGVAFYYLNKASEPPKLEDAPWVIQTFTNDGYRIPERFYFASKVEVLKDGTPKATTYWTYNGKDYTKHEGTMLFPKAVFGNVDIKRRKE